MRETEDRYIACRNGFTNFPGYKECTFCPRFNYCDVRIDPNNFEEYNFQMMKKQHDKSLENRATTGLMSGGTGIMAATAGRKFRNSRHGRIGITTMICAVIVTQDAPLIVIFGGASGAIIIPRVNLDSLECAALPLKKFKSAWSVRLKFSVSRIFSAIFFHSI